MAKARALDRRRKSVRNIRKITRTMELIATARFKKAMDRAHAATAYTRRITELVADLSRTGLEVSHPLLEPRPQTRAATLLVLTGNRGLCGGYNSNVQRLALARWHEIKALPDLERASLEVSGKRGISFFRYRQVQADVTYTHFEDKPSFDEVSVLAHRYLEDYITGKLDRLDVAFTQFESVSRQKAVVETLLPLGTLLGGPPAVKSAGTAKADTAKSDTAGGHGSLYEFLPSAQSILEEVVPTSFQIKLFKCFLDSAVSEQVARMVAMKSATENADQLIKSLSMNYNRARQSQITSEILEVLGGVEALKASS